MKFAKEIVIIILQMIMFYLLPLTAGPTDSMGLVVLLLIGTIILSILIGVLSNSKFKYLYPIFVGVIFIPTVFIYYNSSALVHGLWYFIDSIIGLCVGMVINKIRY